jgi:hypothetical protein
LSSNGATLVEFALILPLFMLLVMGTIDMGRYMAATASVNTAAREAARYGSAIGENAFSVKQYLDCQGMIDAGVEYGAGIDFEDSDFAIIIDGGPGDLSAAAQCEADGTMTILTSVDAGDRVVVTVSRPFSMVSPLVGAFFDPIIITSAGVHEDQSQRCRAGWLDLCIDPSSGPLGCSRPRRR